MGVVGRVITPTRYLPLTKVLLHKALRGIKFSLLLVCCELLLTLVFLISKFFLKSTNKDTLTTKFTQKKEIINLLVCN